MGSMENMGRALWGDAIFLVFLVCWADFDILCSPFFSHHNKFYGLYDNAQDFNLIGLCKW